MKALPSKTKALQAEAAAARARISRMNAGQRHALKTQWLQSVRPGVRGR